MNFVKINSFFTEAGVRFAKFLRQGNKDVQSAPVVMPFGDDSQAPRDWMALYGKTDVNGDNVIIGYINKNVVAGSGEKRIYSVKSDNSLSTYIYLKDDETMEIGGNVDYMVRFNKLKDAFNELKGDFNDLVTKFNTHTHVLSLTAGTGTAAPTLTTGSPSSADINPAKIEEIKTL